MQYAQDYDGRLMSRLITNGDGIAELVCSNGANSTFGDWYPALDPYVKSWDIDNCPGPGETYNRGVALGLNGQAGALPAAVEDPSGTIGITDGCNVGIRYRPADFTGGVSTVHDKVTNGDCSNAAGSC
jgi:hypothetical protein